MRRRPEAARLFRIGRRLAGTLGGTIEVAAGDSQPLVDVSFRSTRPKMAKRGASLW